MMRLQRVALREGHRILDLVRRATVFLLLGLYGCTTTAPDRALPPAPADPEPQIQLSWAPPTPQADGTPAPEVAGYRIYYGLASQQYSFLKSIGPHTTYGLSGLLPGRTYYVAVTAYDQAGTESSLSEEVTVVVPPSTRLTPTLIQEALRHGQQAQFWVTGVFPGETVSFLFSATGEGDGPCAPQLGGLCVDILDPALFAEATADASSTATVTRTIPAELRPGHTIAFQAVIQRGANGEQSVKTNTITARILD